MCGICGFVYSEKINTDQLKLMNNTIQYRGPDSEGYFLENYNQKYQVGMAHKRLAILDLSPLGHQPMLSNDQKIVVVFNGEIYNFNAIKDELISKGYNFKSKTDTEVIINSYKEWGISCVAKFNGMFALAIYDKETNDFFLIRDRMGVKPLYYYLDEKGIIFGSELKPLMSHPNFRKNINKDALCMYLYHGYITAPYSIFQSTYKLEPGHILKFNNGRVSVEQYWSVEKQFLNKKIEHKSEEEWIKELDDLLTDSIKDRMISDVPLGAFLSGGIDSTLITAVMQKISEKPVKTFTIGFHEEKYNEAPFAKKIAEHLGTEHHELYLSTSEAKDLVERMPNYYDEPFADSSQIATMFVSKLAKEHVTVCLSGDGGDELFCGYGSYVDILRRKRIVKYSKLANTVPLFKKCIYKLTKQIKYTKYLEMTNDNNITNAGYRSFIENYNLIKDYKPRFEPKYELIMNRAKDIQEKNMLKDMITYLPDDIMTKVDRASMSVSLESRPPLIDDHRILEISFKMPHDLKYSKGNKKYILKKLLYNYVPRELIDRPKMGFVIPIYEWLKTDMKYLIAKYLGEEFIMKQGILEFAEIEKMLKTFFSNKNDAYVNRIIWNVLVFQLWYDAYM